MDLYFPRAFSEELYYAVGFRLALAAITYFYMESFPATTQSPNKTNYYQQAAPVRTIHKVCRHSRLSTNSVYESITAGIPVKQLRSTKKETVNKNVSAKVVIFE